jgi:hypothetical protein
VITEHYVRAFLGETLSTGSLEAGALVEVPNAISHDIIRNNDAGSLHQNAASLDCLVHRLATPHFHDLTVIL